MSRSPRSDYADSVYHVINRSNARVKIFEAEKDYRAFEAVVGEAKARCDIQLLSYCVMPNHWHLLLQPKRDGELSRFMGWLTMTHTQRWHVAHDSVGTGHLYQGRYKSFPVQTDEYFLTVARYIERNPLRANLVSRAQDWKWGSLWRREQGSTDQQELLDPWPLDTPHNYRDWVNEIEAEGKLTHIRTCVNRGQPFGSDSWVEKIIAQCGLESTVRKEGRPRRENSS